MSEPSVTVAGTRGTDGATPSRVRIILAVASVLVPIGAWAVALFVSWGVQEYTCAAYASVGAPAPEARLRVFLILLNVFMLVLTLAAGAAGLWVARREAEVRPWQLLLRFLGGSGAVGALLFAYSIVLIGIHPIVLRVC